MNKIVGFIRLRQRTQSETWFWGVDCQFQIDSSWVSVTSFAKAQGKNYSVICIAASFDLLNFWAWLVWIPFGHHRCWQKSAWMVAEEGNDQLIERYFTGLLKKRFFQRAAISFQERQPPWTIPGVTTNFISNILPIDQHMRSSIRMFVLPLGRILASRETASQPRCRMN